MTPGLLVALFLLSASLTAGELALMELLATLQWDHLAAAVIAVALMGFGLSGTILALYRSWFMDRAALLLPGLLIGAGVSLAAVPLLITLPGIRFDSMLLFVDRRQLLHVAFTMLVVMVPYLSGALGLGLVFTSRAEHIGRLYAADLTGAGLGTLAGLLLLDRVHAGQACALAGLLPVAGALALPRVSRALTGVMMAVPLALFAVAPAPAWSQFKDLRRVLDTPGAREVARHPSAHGVLSVARSPSLRLVPEMSLHFSGEIPPSTGMFVHGERFGVLDATPGRMRLLEQSMDALGLIAAPGPRVLILDGRDPALALLLAEGTDREVTLVQNHPVAAALLARELSDSGVRVWSCAERLACIRGPWDLVVAPGVGEWGGAGLHALAPERVMTVQGIREIWRSLTPRGALVASAALDWPPRAPLRLSATLAAALADEGVEARRHVVALNGFSSSAWVVMRAPPEKAQLKNLGLWGERQGFDVLALPAGFSPMRERRHVLPDDSLVRGVADIIDGGAFGETYAYDISPVYDGRPYFARFSRWRDLGAFFGDLSFLELGLYVAVVTAVIVAVLSVVLILLPLPAVRGGPTWRVAGYFGALGLAYLGVEMVCLARLGALLGSPVQAAALVIGVMLVSSGVGSALTPRPGGGVRFVPCLVACLVVMLAVTLGRLSAALGGFWLGLAAGVFCAVPALFMGMCFPAGVAALQRRDATLIPWAWGINGCCSVVATVSVPVCAATWGYTPLLLGCAVLYLVAWSTRLLDG